jgi:hypothetical protein
MFRRVDNSDFQAEVFLTDKTLKTLSTVYTPSHHGSSIIISSRKVHTYVVNIKILSNQNPKNPWDCEEYTNDEYDICVDKILQNIWKPIVNCNPPWLSLHNQCTGILNVSDITAKVLFNQPDFYSIFKLERMETFLAMEKCKKPCSITRSLIFEKGYSFIEKYNRKSRLQLLFEKQVVHKTKILGYGFSNFLIDMGSSVGFWFGLSVFGLIDLGIATLNWFKSLSGKAKKTFK